MCSGVCVLDNIKVCVCMYWYVLDIIGVVSYFVGLCITVLAKQALPNVHYFYVLF